MAEMSDNNQAASPLGQTQSNVQVDLNKNSSTQERNEHFRHRTHAVRTPVSAIPLLLCLKMLTLEQQPPTEPPCQQSVIMCGSQLQGYLWSQCAQQGL